MDPFSAFVLALETAKAVAIAFTEWAKFLCTPAGQELVKSNIASKEAFEGAWNRLTGDIAAGFKTLVASREKK